MDNRLIITKVETFLGDRFAKKVDVEVQVISPNYFNFVAGQIFEPARLWQPMETAPKDGSMILVSDGKNTSVVLWYKGNTGPYWMTYLLSSKVKTANIKGWQPLPDAKI